MQAALFTFREYHWENLPLPSKQGHIRPDTADGTEEPGPLDQSRLNYWELGSHPESAHYTTHECDGKFHA